MDLAYLRAHPQHLPTFLTHQRIRETPVGGGSICQARRLTLDDGASVFAQVLNDPTDERPTRPVPEQFFETEAAGLRWLAEARRRCPYPRSSRSCPDLLVLEWVEPGTTRPRPRPSGSGATWPPRTGPARTRSVRPGPATSARCRRTTPPASAWPEWFAERRLAPYLRMAGRPRRAQRRGRRAGRAGARAGSTGTGRRPSPRPGCTVTCGRATCSGPPTAGCGWSTRPRTAGTGRPTWPSWPSSAARRTWTGSSAAYRGGLAAGRRLAGPGAAAPAASAARARGAVRRRRTGSSVLGVCRGRSRRA